MNSISTRIIHFMDMLRNSKFAKQKIIYFKLVIGISHLVSNNILKTQIDHMFNMTKDSIIHVRLTALQSLLLVYQKNKVSVLCFM
jgi:hypothetical protein